MSSNTIKVFLGAFLFGSVFTFTTIQIADQPITSEMIQQASGILGLEFTAAERDTMTDALEDNREDFQNLRKLKLDNSIPPAVTFNPVPAGKTFDKTQQNITWDIPALVDLPQNKNDLAFYSVAQLSSLIKKKNHFT